MATYKVEDWVRNLPAVGDVLLAKAREINKMHDERRALLRAINLERKSLEAHARKLWSGVEIKRAKDWANKIGSD